MRVQGSRRVWLACVLVLGMWTEVWAGGEWPGWLAPVPEGVRLELPELAAEVPAPPAVLGYPLGERFTGWEEARRYLAALAERSGRVAVWEYGETYEGRPLVLAAVTSEGNLGRLEEIRRNRARLAEPEAMSAAERERLERETPAVVWLGYGIHGNETSSLEAALGTAYVLAAAGGLGTAVLDPAALDAISPLARIQLRVAHSVATDDDRSPDYEGYYSANSTQTRRPRLELEYID